MNNSRHTVALARGIYLWARIQDLPTNASASASDWQKWNEWKANKTQAEIKLVQDTQYKLFDDCLRLN